MLAACCSCPARLPLHHGGSLEQPSSAWRLAGPPGAPVVVALGGISAHRRVFDIEQPRAGWWREIAGPGRALDSTRVRILGIDYLGGSGESTGPTAGGVFPSLSSYDQAEALRQLLDHLQHRRLRAIVGASYGGMVALAFAERYRRAGRAAAGHQRRGSRPSHVHRLAQRAAAHRALRAVRPGTPADGMELARALAMATYRSPEEFAARFAMPPRADRRSIRVSGRGISVRARPRLCRALSARVVSVPVGIDRSACVDAAPHRDARPRWWRCARISWCRSPTCARWRRACRMRGCTRCPRCTATTPFSRRRQRCSRYLQCLYGDAT